MKLSITGAPTPFVSGRSDSPAPKRERAGAFALNEFAVLHPKTKTASTQALGPAEMAALLVGKRDIDSVRAKIIQANGGSRVLGHGLIEHMKARLAASDTRPAAFTGVRDWAAGTKPEEVQARESQGKAIDELTKTLDMLYHEAVQNKKLVQQGTQLPRSGLISKGSSGQTGLMVDKKNWLHQEVLAFRPDHIGTLLDLGARLDKIVSEQTPLQAAYNKGDRPNFNALIAILKYQQQRGDENAVDQIIHDNKTAIMLAVEQKNIEAVKELLALGATLPERMSLGTQRDVSVQVAPAAQNTSTQSNPAAETKETSTDTPPRSPTDVDTGFEDLFQTFLQLQLAKAQEKSETSSLVRARSSSNTPASASTSRAPSPVKSPKASIPKRSSSEDFEDLEKKFRL